MSEAGLDIARQIQKIERIGGMAVAEIQKRLKNSPDDFNSATLVRLATEATKIQVAFDRRDKPKEQNTKSLTQVLVMPGLPPERQKQVLEQTIQKFGAEAQELQAQLDALEANAS